MTSNTSQFSGNHLTWTVHRTDRTFRVYVVEPRTYEPSNHAAIFNAALMAMVSPTRPLLDPFGEDVPELVGEPFDLITFPEAFLPAERLVAALGEFAALQSLGCVHVGLRPSADENHLFTVPELRQLVRSITDITNIEAKDSPPGSKRRPTTSASISHVYLQLMQRNAYAFVCIPSFSGPSSSSRHSQSISWTKAPFSRW